MRSPSPFDFLIERIDAGLRTLSGNISPARERPDANVSDQEMPAETKKAHGKLMRVNHSGEICAQALYHGQALTARSEETREHLLRAADEEGDHLAWCASRAKELGVRTSILNPLFYAQSFTIGALAGLAGDRWSFGFISETETQVCEHLAGHIARMDTADEKSRAIIEQMHADEAQHGEDAKRAGGKPLPAPIKHLMQCAAKVMTSTTYRL